MMKDMRSLIGVDKHSLAKKIIHVFREKIKQRQISQFDKIMVVLTLPWSVSFDCANLVAFLVVDQIDQINDIRFECRSLHRHLSVQLPP